jgi:hypothetical protein
MTTAAELRARRDALTAQRSSGVATTHFGDLVQARRWIEYGIAGG